MGNEVVIVPGGDGTLSKAQQQFNDSIAAIRALKEDLARVQAELPWFRAQVGTLIGPSLAELNEARRSVLKAVHASPAHKKLTRNQQEALAGIMTSWALYLMRGPADEEMRIIFHAYADHSLSEYLPQPRSGPAPEPEADPEPTTERQPFTPRKKTARQEEKARKLAEASKKLSQSTKKVYFDLVRHFHPDQEQDPEIRAQKDRIMQDINAAYNDDDFLKLLELQMNLLSSKAFVNRFSTDEDLKYFNILLKQQINALTEEKRSLLPEGAQSPFMACFVPGNQAQSVRNLKKQATRLLAAAKGYRQLAHEVDTASGLRDFIDWFSEEQEEDEP